MALDVTAPGDPEGSLESKEPRWEAGVVVIAERGAAAYISLLLAFPYHG